MAFTDALNTTGELAFVYDELTVLLGASDGSNPSTGVDADPGADPPVDASTPDFFPNVYCARVVQSAGGSRLDYADLVYGNTGYLRDREQPSGFARIVEVRAPNAAATLLHRGDYVRESAMVKKDGEVLTGQSQLRPYHFGEPVIGYAFHNPQITAAADTDGGIEIAMDDIVFNPTVDDRVLFNMSTVVRVEGGLTGHVWTHPELASTDIGEEYQEQSRLEWTIKEAVKSMCELLNPAADHIAIPSTFNLGALDDAPPLRDVRIPLGSTLPQALDTLLIAHGYNWFVDYEADPIGIAVFKIGEGDEKELKMQPPGDVLDLSLSNVNQWSTDNAIGDSFNEVLVYGEFEEAEFTFPLYRAWSPQFDSLSAASLAKDGEEYAGHETVWRLFIANEAGDLDPDYHSGPEPVVPEFFDVFTIAVPHRRVLGEPLTWLKGTIGTVEDGGPSTDRQRMPHVVEWSDDAGATWKPAEESWTIKLCPDQIGILFDGKEIPEELYDAGDQGRLRITGSIFADSRINYLAEKQAWAANGRKVTQVVVKPDKFQWRTRATTGDYASILTGDFDERDDTAAIQEFAEKLRDRNHYAEIDCEFRLPGWHLEYKIGDLITKIAGREISLDAAPAEAPENRYVQIVERRFEMTPDGGPSTVLIVDRGISQA